jgi:hypothetical protein
MKQHWKEYNSKIWVVALPGILYSGLIYYQGALTGMNVADGIIGVVLGLYISAHPAANVVGMLFRGRSGQPQFLSLRSAILWFTENMLILLTGWITIFFGTTRLIGRAD